MILTLIKLQEGLKGLTDLKGKPQLQVVQHN